MHWAGPGIPAAGEGGDEVHCAQLGLDANTDLFGRLEARCISTGLPADLVTFVIGGADMSCEVVHAIDDGFHG